jgi:hypothetical protein
MKCVGAGEDLPMVRPTSLSRYSMLTMRALNQELGLKASSEGDKAVDH